MILGAVLAPTDPVLAGDVGVPSEEEDEREAHFALTAEAGLNDGLAFPFVLAGVFIAAEGGTGWAGEWLAADVLYAIVLGVALGAAGGYGFLAAFAAGFAFRRYEHGHEVNRRMHDGAEVVEKFSELALILVLGSLVTVSGLGEAGLTGWLLVPALLLVIRRLATLVAFAGSEVALRDRAFIGWFGVRGVGSLYYVAVAVGTGVLSGGEAVTVFWTVTACIVVSIVVHGVTASPLSQRLNPH